MIASDKNRAILAEIIAGSLREPELRAKLKSAPKETLTAAGMELRTEDEVVILENNPSVIHAILPTLAEEAKYDALITQASAHIKQLPEGMELRIFRDSPEKLYVVLPHPISEGASVSSMELSDEALEAVAGGKGGGSVPTGNIQTQTNITTTTNVAEVEVQAAVAVQAAAAVAEGVAVAVAAAVAVVVVPCFIS